MEILYYWEWLCLLNDNYKAYYYDYDHDYEGFIVIVDYFD